MANYLAYTPGNEFSMSVQIASVDSNANMTAVIGMAPVAGTLRSVYYMPTATIAATTTVSKAKTLKIVNGGQTGTATTIIASARPIASAAAFLPVTITTTTDPTFAAGDVIKWESVSTGSSIDLEAGTISVRYRVIQP